MEAFVYQGDIWCEDCARAIAEDLDAKGVEDDGDSDTYPQGPYPEGGGEADCPQHCGGGDGCINAEDVGNASDIKVGAFLENPLTDEGREYVRDAVQGYYCESPARGNGIVAEWSEFYDIRPDHGEEE